MTVLDRAAPIGDRSPKAARPLSFPVQTFRFRPIADIAISLCYRDEMTTTVSRGVYRHGKRHRFSVTPKDDSPEAFKAALVELDETVRAFTHATTPKISRQSYRKAKGD